MPDLINLALKDLLTLKAEDAGVINELGRRQRERVKQFDHAVRAFVHFREGAYTASHACSRSPLSGLTVAHKDVIDVAGMETTGGVPRGRPYVPAVDAALVSLLHWAGMRTVGKLNLQELGFGSMEAHGDVINPHVANGWPGGSSSGSGAAVAAGFLTFATGTDTGGSVRHPAAYCGVVGYRPTFGRLSTDGIIPLARGQDTPGIIARNTPDLELLFDAALRLRDADPDTRPWGELEGIRIGVPRPYFYEDLHPEVEVAMESALSAFRGAGACVVDVATPDPLVASAASWVLAYAQSADYHAKQPSFQRGDHTQAFLAKIDIATQFSSHEKEVAGAIASNFREAVAALFEEVDVLLVPTVRNLASSAQNVVPVAHPRFPFSPELTSLTRPFSIARTPVVSLPIGTAQDGSPIGAQVVGRRLSDRRLLARAAAMERHLGTIFRAVDPQQSKEEELGVHAGVPLPVNADVLRDILTR